MKRNSRHYAKKQLTWFRHQDEYVWLHPDQAKNSILKFGRLLSEAENLMDDIRTKLDYFINNVPSSAGDIVEKAKQAKNDI